MYLRLLVSNTTLFQMMFVSFDSNSTGVTRWAGNVNPSEAPAFTPAFSEVRVGRSLVICVMIGWLLFALLFFFFWPLCCLSFCLFLLAIVSSVLLSFSFGHCIFCPSVFFFWPLYYLSFCLFLLAIVLSVLLSFAFGHWIICPSSYGSTYPFFKLFIYHPKPDSGATWSGKLLISE